MSKKISTVDRLVQALTGSGAPTDMIMRAAMGYYDDFKSELVAPIYQLVMDARAAGLDHIAKLAADGEFDAQAWEADEWMKAEGPTFLKEHQ